MKTFDEDSQTLSESYNKELEQLSRQTVLNPAYRKKKLLLWTIRTLITVALYILFWKHDWVRWTLVLILPLSLFSLFMIVAAPYLLRKKMESTGRKIEAAERAVQEAANT